MSKIRVLVGCEYSATVRDAFNSYDDVEAWSCDLLPADVPSDRHIVGDVFDVIRDGDWDLLIGFPPCTYLTVSGAWLFADRADIKRNVADGVLVGQDRKAARVEALQFVRKLETCGIPYVALENPSRSSLCTMYRRPDQVVQPFQYGHDASKSTGLWLTNLPPIRPGNEHVEPRMVKSDKTGKLLPRWANQTDSGQNALPPTGDRWKIRSETYQGIADAMAETWVNHIRNERGQ